MWNNPVPSYNIVYQDVGSSQHHPWNGQYAPVPTPPMPPVANPPSVTAMPAAQQQIDDSEHKNKRRRLSAEEKAQRSRERNRMHARKTRQRKKMQIRMLRSKVEELEEDQRRLKQALNDRKTANILLAMSASPDGCNTQLIDIEVLNDDDLSLNATTSTTTYGDSNSIEFGSEHRSEDEGDFSDSSRYSDELHRGTSETVDSSTIRCEKGERGSSTGGELQSESDLALKLLNKDKDFCTPQELELIRRERNRMHAKKTRDRKKLYLEETENTISRLEEENRKLRDSIQKLGTLSLILPVRPAIETNPHVSGAQLLMNVMNDPKKSAAAETDRRNKISDTQSDTNSESESNTSLEPRSSSSNGNGSSRSDDSNSVDDDSNVNGNSHEYDTCNHDSIGNGSGSSAAEETNAEEEHPKPPQRNPTK
mmetsp:Transcript_34201/g.45214  ORF Transcript_34201/g.45214 Transcript_34201/m.45214 type:complete len:423 (-) Transcript_34201:173-1441(-)|eukprot:CAMPEP_0117759706 /NCGR_PEP_ID=MMETSP0947-20121206/16170_1 /TAXON_ID=44440 /ORGANISM="Chattonella subsalsa, Strain CCMP2191" /LENGTH=422 /DNA_ID=CAMNT_0005580209 /DNA_START=145 /DNA_END=1413 /DNA_ORIENTATION=-